MNKTVIKLKCPKCDFGVKAELKGKFNKFVLYFCPKCNSNVVFYNNKVDIISDAMVLELQKKLKTCGATYFSRNKSKKAITEDDIINLRILLETEMDFDKILAKL